MFGITRGTSCAPKENPHHLVSLDLLENVVPTPSGCLSGLVLPDFLFFVLHFLCVFVCLVWGCFHMFGIALGTSCAPKDGPSPWQSQFVGECSSDALWLLFGPLLL